MVTCPCRQGTKFPFTFNEMAKMFPFLRDLNKTLVEKRNSSVSTKYVRNVMKYIKIQQTDGTTSYVNTKLESRKFILLYFGKLLLLVS